VFLTPSEQRRTPYAGSPERNLPKPQTAGGAGDLGSFSAVLGQEKFPAAAEGKAQFIEIASSTMNHVYAMPNRTAGEGKMLGSHLEPGIANCDCNSSVFTYRTDIEIPLLVTR
jgi:hypothetical protein